MLSHDYKNYREVLLRLEQPIVTAVQMFAKWNFISLGNGARYVSLIAQAATGFSINSLIGSWSQF